MNKVIVALAGILLGGVAPLVAKELPPAATQPVSFAKDIAPLFEKTCVKCHAKGKDKGGFSLENRESFLRGGDSGAAAEAGKSAESYLVELVAGVDPDDVMPKKGSRWTPEQVGLLRAWIDQGMPWDAGLSFAKPEPRNLKPQPAAAAVAEGHSVNAILARYFAENKITAPAPIDDAHFARRAYLDVIGLLPTPEQLDAFVSDASADKRERLVRTLLADSRGYAENWLTFWNDLLRNDYKGTGFIDGGRRQITGWLYDALVQNRPYDQFVRDLVNPSQQTLGFTAGILWRGTVNASMTPPMQAAQNISQVFLGVNLKCASCHDSFINDWSLADAYGVAAVYSDTPLELVHCDKPTGKQAALRFLYPQVGNLDPAVPKAERLRQFAGLMTAPQNGRLARTVVNRLWARLLGRGLVEPVDDMEQPAWNAELLDALAEDLVAHGYDLKRTLEVILTSQAYQLPVAAAPREKEAYVFNGPLARRLTAEQFGDAVSSLTDDWAKLPATLEVDLSGGGKAGEFTAPKWIWTNESVGLANQRIAARAAKAKADEAARKSAEAAQLLESGAPKAAEKVAQAAAAADEASKAAHALETAAQGDERHRVIFRKKFTLGSVPTRAYGTVAGSQTFDLLVNGKAPGTVLADGTRGGRVRLYNLQPLLKQGENVVVISIDSHTEKAMNEDERKEFPASRKHLNARSGVGFYARCSSTAEVKEIISDESWRVRRAAAGELSSPALDDHDWAVATLVPADAAPVDEGPGLEPIRRKDFANQPIDLGFTLRPAASIAALVGDVRAALVGADPLALALDRPNREQVATTRLIAPTTMQALELTNGSTLDTRLRGAASRLAATVIRDPAAWADRLFVHALGRHPAPAERELTLALLGESPRPESISDTLWAVLMLPEFQLID